MSKRSRDDFPDDREIRRRMGNPTAAYYKVRTSRKKFRKSRKPIVDKGKFVSRNYDDYGTVEKDFTMYVGFQHHGSRGRLYDIIGEAVTKAFLAKLKIYPRSYDEVLFSQDYSRVSLYFKRVKATGVADTETTVTHDIHGVSFKSLAFNVALSIEQQADGSTSVAPTVDSVARYLSRIVMWNDTATDNARMEIGDVGDAVLSVKVNQTIRFQNITKNIDGTVKLDQAGLNPLRGRKYAVSYTHLTLPTKA